MSIPPLYHSTRFGSGHIALVSPVYTGTIAVLDTKTMDSRVIGDNNLLPYQEYDINRRSYYESSGEVGFVSNSGSMGQFFYKTIGSTIGLVGNSNYLLHFYMLFEGRKRIPYVSIYSVDGNLLTTSILEKSPLGLVIDNALMSAPRYLDEDNNLYLTAYHPFPTIRVFETNLDELTME